MRNDTIHLCFFEKNICKYNVKQEGVKRFNVRVSSYNPGINAAFFWLGAAAFIGGGI